LGEWKNVNRAIFKCPIPGVIQNPQTFRPTFWTGTLNNVRIGWHWTASRKRLEAEYRKVRAWELKRIDRVPQVISELKAILRRGPATEPAVAMVATDDHCAVRASQANGLVAYTSIPDPVGQWEPYHYEPPPRKPINYIGTPRRARPIDAWQLDAEQKAIPFK
jgi:hypothetical protein